MSTRPNQIHLFRHAESAKNIDAERKKIVAGHEVDSPLTEIGMEQAYALREYMREYFGELPTLAYSSPMERTVRTASIALDAETTDARIVTDPRLLEIDRGQGVGKLMTEVYSQSPLDEKASWDHAEPDGESLADVAKRMEAFATDHQTEGPIIVFSHSTSIKALVGKIRGLSHFETLDVLSAPPVSHTILDWTDGRLTVATDNVGRRTHNL